jgi:hypothetical protein
MVLYISKENIMKEIWKPIVGWEDLYHISNLGRVKRISPTKYTPKFNNVLRPREDRDGYLVLHLSRRGKKKYVHIHRLVAISFIGSPPPGDYTVNHKNGNKKDNRPQNLEWVTRRENDRHARDVLGMARLGEGHGMSKLTKEQVKEIRALYKTGTYTQTGLGRIFDVTNSAIWRIVHRRTWVHI